MFDLLATIGSAVVGDIIKRAVSVGIGWGKRRKKPTAEEVRQKVEEFVADAAQTTPFPESLPAADQKRIIAGIAELTLPTFEQVVEYSPSTQRIVNAARRVAKRAPAKKAARKALARKAAPKKAPAKKAALRKALKK
jgi:DNA-binding protein HU-beta